MIFASLAAYALIALSSSAYVSAGPIQVACNSGGGHCIYTPAKASRATEPTVSVGAGQLRGHEVDGAGQGTYLIAKGGGGEIDIQCNGLKAPEKFIFAFDGIRGISQISSDSGNKNRALVHFAGGNRVNTGSVVTSQDPGADIVVTC